MAEMIVSRAAARAQGLTHYFTGLACHRGHVAKRIVSSFACVECSREKAAEARAKDPEGCRRRDRIWRDANRERLRKQENERNATPENRAKRLARRALWREKNRDNLRADDARWRSENPERARAKGKRHYWKDPQKQVDRIKRYHEQNPEKRAQYLAGEGGEKAKAWREAHKDELRDYQKRWYAENRDKKHSYIHKRRALKKASSGSYTDVDISEILVAQDNKCAYCRASLKKVKRHIDHIIPLSRGGSNDRSNIQILCEPCNLKKGSKEPIDFAQSRGLLL